MKLPKRVRKLVRRIPMLRARDERKDAVTRPPRPPAFTGSRAYWEKRYAKGGNSGVGSYSKFTKFKAATLNEFVAANSIETVIEFGCGDGNQLTLAQYPRYLGFDVSATAVDLCRSRFAGDETKSFKLLDGYAGETAELAISLDVIFHLIEDEEFEEHMRMLFGSANHFVIIYSSNTNESTQEENHIKHRQFTKWIAENAPGWSLERHIANRYPYKGDHEQGSFADFYIYGKSLRIGSCATLPHRVHEVL